MMTWIARVAGALTLAGAGAANAGMGWTDLPASEALGPVTLFYPSDVGDAPTPLGPFVLPLAPDAPPQRGNGRLVVVSHGTGGSAWVHADLARALVQRGFVVALPLHRADNYQDRSDAPGALERRPHEVSATIDALGREPRFAPLLELDRVGVFGFSAGGHTALTLAGGRWSYDRFRRHCDQDLADDFAFCVGAITALDGGVLDGVKQWLARLVIGLRFRDATPRGHVDERIAAVVAAAPAAAIFDLDTLATPRVPLALATAGQDRWLVPRFHAERVLQACTSCERPVDLPGAGHGVYLSPRPPALQGRLAELLDDGPGFERSVLAAAHQRVADWLERQLVR
jgi:predicted dienelactone hydrolase